MIKSIVENTDWLSNKCEICLFTEKEQKQNKNIIEDLIDTANIHNKNCVGLASNQIGYNKRIILVLIKDKFIPFINPVILPLKTNGIKRWHENCLSFPGKPAVQKRRYKKIKVKYNTITCEEKEMVLKGFKTAIMQHECDHLNGVII